MAGPRPQRAPTAAPPPESEGGTSLRPSRVPRDCFPPGREAQATWRLTPPSQEGLCPRCSAVGRNVEATRGARGGPRVAGAVAEKPTLKHSLAVDTHCPHVHGTGRPSSAPFWHTPARPHTAAAVLGEVPVRDPQALRPGASSPTLKRRSLPTPLPTSLFWNLPPAWPLRASHDSSLPSLSTRSPTSSTAPLLPRTHEWQAPTSPPRAPCLVLPAAELGAPSGLGRLWGPEGL